MRGLSVGQLFSLRALLRYRSISMAARDVAVSQPAMSLTLKKLRETFDDLLLVQEGKKLHLTAFAENLIPKLDEIYEKINQLNCKSTDFDPNVNKRKFIISTPSFYEHIILKQCIKLNNITNGNVEFEVKVLNFCNVEVFQKEFLDIAYTFNFFSPEPSAFMNTKLITKDKTACCVKKNGILDKGRLNNEDYLSANHLILKHHEISTGSYIDSLFLISGRHRKIAAVGSSVLSSIMALTEQEDHLILTGPRCILAHYSQYFPIQIYPLPFDIPDWQLWSVWHEANENDRGFSWLLSQLNPLSMSIEM